MRVLVQRYSALGDIMILLPILHALKSQNPDIDLAFVSRSYLKPLFSSGDISFFGADLRGKHKGFLGLWRLSREIKHAFNPDLVIDQHSVLRSRLVNFFFRIQGVKVFRLRKNRAARKQLTRKENKVFEPLTPIHQLYQNTFRQAGIDFIFNPHEIAELPYVLQIDSAKWWAQVKNKTNIGVAPFASHRAKAWPLEKMQDLLQQLSNTNTTFFFFGDAAEHNQLTNLGEQAKISFHVVAGKLSIDQELALMRHLDVMIAMDSANMHMSAWAKTRVVSVWGATHPFAGFAPYGQNAVDMVGISNKELACRPCSVFGNKPCWRGDYACLNTLSSNQVLERFEVVRSQ